MVWCSGRYEEKRSFDKHPKDVWTRAARPAGVEKASIRFFYQSPASEIATRSRAPQGAFWVWRSPRHDEKRSVRQTSEGCLDARSGGVINRSLSDNLPEEVWTRPTRTQGGKASAMSSTIQPLQTIYFRRTKPWQCPEISNNGDTATQFTRSNQNYSLFPDNSPAIPKVECRKGIPKREAEKWAYFLHSAGSKSSCPECLHYHRSRMTALSDCFS